MVLFVVVTMCSLMAAATIGGTVVWLTRWRRLMGELAASPEATLLPKRLLAPPQFELRHEGCMFSVEVGRVRGDESSQEFWLHRVSGLALGSRGPMHIGSKGLLDMIAAAWGKHDLQLDVPELDKKFRLAARDGDALRRLFADAGFAEAVTALQARSGWLFSISLDEGGTLTFSSAIQKRSLDEAKAVANLAAVVVHSMEQLAADLGLPKGQSGTAMPGLGAASGLPVGVGVRR